MTRIKIRKHTCYAWKLSQLQPYSCPIFIVTFFGFFAGAIKAESFTRIPPTVGGSTMRPEPMDCPPNVTGSSDEPMGLSDLGAVGEFYYL